MKRALLASLGLLVGSALAHAQSAAAPDPARLFDYDRKQPLDIQEKATYDRNGVRVIDLSYASPRQGRVTPSWSCRAERGRLRPSCSATGAAATAPNFCRKPSSTRRPAPFLC